MFIVLVGSIAYDSSRCVSLAFLQGGKCLIVLEAQFLPPLDGEWSWKKDLYPARCVGRESEFMPWVNDPCSSHHWWEQVAKAKLTLQGMGLAKWGGTTYGPLSLPKGTDMWSHPTVSTLVQTFVSVHLNYYNCLPTGPLFSPPSSPMPLFCWQSWVSTAQTCLCYFSPKNPSIPLLLSAEPQVGSHHLAPT